MSPVFICIGISSRHSFFSALKTQYNVPKHLFTKQTGAIKTRVPKLPHTVSPIFFLLTFYYVKKRDSMPEFFLISQSKGHNTLLTTIQQTSILDLLYTTLLSIVSLYYFLTLLCPLNLYCTNTPVAKSLGILQAFQ